MSDKPEDKKGEEAGKPEGKPAADKAKGAKKGAGKAGEASPTGAESPAKPDSEKTPDTEAAKPVKEAAEKEGRPETVQEKPEPKAGAAAPAEKPAATLGPEAAGTAAPPASAASTAASVKPGAEADTTKPSAPAAAGAAAGAAKPAAPGAAHAAAPAAPEPPKEPGPFGNFLKDVGIASTRLPDSVGTAGMVETIQVDAKDLEQAMKSLRGSEMRMTYLLMVSGVETADSYDSVYHVWSFEDTSKELVVKVKVAKASITEGQLPAVPSLTPFWQAANWHEREEYDLMGIKYFGHPYLRRLMNPWDWEGYPLRKDYKQPVDALNDKNPHSMR